MILGGGGVIDVKFANRKETSDSGGRRVLRGECNSNKRSSSRKVSVLHLATVGGGGGVLFEIVLILEGGNYSQGIILKGGNFLELLVYF